MLICRLNSRGWQKREKRKRCRGAIASAKRISRKSLYPIFVASLLHLSRKPAQFDKGSHSESSSHVFFGQSFRYFSRGTSRTVSGAGHDQKRSLSGRSSRKRITVSAGTCTS